MTGWPDIECLRPVCARRRLFSRRRNGLEANSESGPSLHNSVPTRGTRWLPSTGQTEEERDEEGKLANGNSEKAEEDGADLESAAKDTGTGGSMERRDATERRPRPPLRRGGEALESKTLPALGERTSPRDLDAGPTKSELSLQHAPSSASNAESAIRTETQRLTLSCDTGVARYIPGHHLKPRIVNVKGGKAVSSANTLSDSVARHAENSNPDPSEIPLPASPESPPTPIDEGLAPLKKRVTFRDELPGQFLADVVSLEQKNLVEVLADWADARRSLCKLRTSCHGDFWMHENWETLFQPFVLTANRVNMLITAFRDSEYCPTECRFLESEGPELKELNKAEEMALARTIECVTEVLGIVLDACSGSCSGFDRATRLITFRSNSRLHQKNLKQRMEQLRESLESKGINVQDDRPSKNASGALNTPSHSVSEDIGPLTPLATRPRRRPAWVNNIGVSFELDGTSSRRPLLAMIQYHRIKLRFRRVPISVPAPVTVVETAADSIQDWTIHTKRCKPGRAMAGKVELEEEDRTKVVEAIKAHEQFQEKLSSQDGIGAALLRHKIATRILRYEARLQGRTHMCNKIHMLIEHEPDSDRQHPNSKDAVAGASRDELVVSDIPRSISADVVLPPSRSRSLRQESSYEQEPHTPYGPVFDRPNGYLRVGEVGAGLPELYGFR
ncbi:hypothetical protein SCARD494_07297 [Seiridium cardinale]